MSNPTGTVTTDRLAAPDAAYLVPLSAPTPEALIRAAAALRDLLAAQPGLDLSTLAGDLSRRPTRFPARAAFAAVSLSKLAERLDAFVRENTPASTISARHQTPRILMVFGGRVPSGPAAGASSTTPNPSSAAPSTRWTPPGPGRPASRCATRVSPRPRRTWTRSGWPSR